MKTFDEILVEQPNLYTGVAGYTWDTTNNQWVNTGISEVCKAQIEDWFGLREVCDDTNFAKFFRRKLNITAWRYAQQLRLELTTFDPLVAEYMEREVLNNHSKSVAGSSDETTTGSTQRTSSNTEVRTPDITEFTEGETGSQNSITHGGSDTTSGSTSAENNHVEIGKNAPQSIMNAGAVAGEIPDQDWTYATSVGQGRDNNAGSTSSTTNYGSTQSGSENSDEEKTVHTSGTETIVGSNNDTEGRNGSKFGSSSSAESGSGQEREIYTGRHGMTPQAALQSAISYIKTASSFEWLKTELEDCFFAVYDT